MVELWIPLTIAGAFCQNLRSALQKHLKAHLSTAGAAYVRFLYAWPFALLYVWSLTHFGGFEIPEINTKFLIFCLLGGLSQIAFTFLLVWLFSFRNFAAGIIYSKTETAQVAVLGLLILGDPLSTGTILAIAVSLIGVLALSVAQTEITFRNLVTSLYGKTTLIGLACGAALGTSVVLFRGAALSLGGEGFLMQAGFSLAVSLLIQTLIMGTYLAVMEKGQLRAVLVHWRPALMVGVAAALSSIFWRSAYTLQSAAYVRALGQIELVFAILITTVFFREKIKSMELVGIMFISGGILILIMTRA
jgi:drug/metabolite transporter (DMT)-like permease